MKLQKFELRKIPLSSLFAKGGKRGILILAFLLSACATTTRYDLGSLPVYDQTSADEAWLMIHEIEQAQALFVREIMMRVYAGYEFSAEIKDEIRRLNEQVLYWKAVAEVQIFHSDYESARVNAVKVKKLLAEMKAVLARTTQPQTPVRMQQEIRDQTSEIRGLSGLADL